MISKSISVLGLGLVLASVFTFRGESGWLPWSLLAIGIITLAVGLYAIRRPSTANLVGAPSVITLALFAVWAAGLIDNQSPVALWIGLIFAVSALFVALSAGAKREADWNGENAPMVERKKSDSERLQDIA